MNKQKLQEQIDTMREELAKMETELAECEKVELIHGSYSIMDRYYKAPFNTPEGTTRATKELAEIASKNMVTRNKLEAYAQQIDPEWRDNGIGYNVWSVSYSLIGKYKVTGDCDLRRNGCVYMSKSTAEQICEWLNDGRIEL